MPRQDTDARRSRGAAAETSPSRGESNSASPEDLDEPQDQPTTRPDGVALGARGNRTRDRLLAAAEEVFLQNGYYEASVTKITTAAEVSQGTFYTYFTSKQEIFEHLVIDLNRRLRRELTEASAGATDPIEIEQRGFEALVDFTRRHPALFRVIRQSEFVAPATMRRHYELMSGGYKSRLAESEARGEIYPYEPEVLTWALMGIAEMIAMRWTMWEDQDAHDVPLPTALQEVGRFLARALQPDPDSASGQGATSP
jgi:AcrR family transcriptional regulator